jgi:phosphotransferase system HPr-like phosphotransfer protein
MIKVTIDEKGKTISMEAVAADQIQYISSVRLKEDGTDAQRVGEALLKLVEKAK